jgi:hypothetical protein
LVIGSDILYERDERGNLAHYINEHVEDHSEVWVVDPNQRTLPPTKAECSHTPAIKREHRCAIGHRLFQSVQS